MSRAARGTRLMPCMNRRPVTAIRHDRPYWPPSACGLRPVARSWAGVRARDRIGVRGSGPQLSCIVVEPVRDVPCSGVATDGHDAHAPGENSSLFADNTYTMGNLPSSRWTLHGRWFPAAVVTVAGQGGRLVVPPLGRPPAPPAALPAHAASIEFRVALEGEVEALQRVLSRNPSSLTGTPPTSSTGLCGTFKSPSRAWN